MSRTAALRKRNAAEAFANPAAALVVAAARAVLAGFRQEIDTGTMRPPQHASLRLLEEAVSPFADDPGVEAAPGGPVGGQSPAPVGRSAPATANDQSPPA